MGTTIHLYLTPTIAFVSHETVSILLLNSIDARRDLTNIHISVPRCCESAGDKDVSCKRIGTFPQVQSVEEIHCSCQAVHTYTNQKIVKRKTYQLIHEKTDTQQGRTSLEYYFLRHCATKVVPAVPPAETRMHIKIPSLHRI